MTDLTPTCGQHVSPDDDCCGPDGVCSQPAMWVHPATGAMLCELHEANARQYSHSDQWRVGRLDVSYPAGWERLPPVAEPPPVLEVVRFDGDGSSGGFEVG